MDFLATDEITFTGCLVRVTKQQLTELKSLATLTLLKQTGLHLRKDLTGLLLIKALIGLQPTLQRTFLIMQILLA